MTARCPLTYERIDAEHRYSQAGLRRLNRRLCSLAPLAFSAAELLAEAARRAPRMAIQGVQPKLSLVLDLREQAFVVVDTAGRYILKPPHPLFPSLPENEDVTMRLAAAAGITTPLHGLIYAVDGSLSYLVRRFDRRDRKPDRVPMEDFAQLTARSRETKYDSSLERVITAVERYCTFPRVELSRLFRRVLFCFLVGNEDMHLKNYSVITEGRVVRLAPAYDLLNTTLVLGDEAVESALPIDGKNRGLTRRLLVDYVGRRQCGLPSAEIDSVLGDLAGAVRSADELLARSFLPDALRTKYAELVHDRAQRLFG